MAKIFSTKNFEINDEYSVYCRSENTSYGFRHVAELQKNNWQELETAKCCYYNRTWEAYEFESVLEALLAKVKKNKTLSEEGIKLFENSFDKWSGKAHEEVEKEFGLITAIAKMGEVLTDTKAEQNDWKKRMLKAGLGEAIDFPDDWDTLTEEQKEVRLNGAISALK